MQDYQIRVIEEKKVLDDKIRSLSAFIEHSAIFKNLSFTEQQQLLHQETVMLEYSQILGERISAFV